jgi:hypothetical protein
VDLDRNVADSLHDETPVADAVAGGGAAELAAELFAILVGEQRGERLSLEVGGVPSKQ